MKHQSTEVPTGTEIESKMSCEQQKLHAKSNFSPVPNVEWHMTMELSILCQIITADVFFDDLLAFKRAGKMATANDFNREPTSVVLERSTPWLHLKGASWHSLSHFGNVTSTLSTASSAKGGEGATATPNYGFATDTQTSVLTKFCVES